MRSPLPLQRRFVGISFAVFVRSVSFALARSCGGPTQEPRADAAHVRCALCVSSLRGTRALLTRRDQAIYFISPTERSVRQLIDDFSGPQLLYRRAHVFFSNRAPPSLLHFHFLTHLSLLLPLSSSPPPEVEKRLLNGIKNSAPLTERLGTLKEFNMEYLVLDSRVFTTATPDDLSALYAAGAAAQPGFEATVEELVSRLATLFASLRECPAIRYRAPRADLADEEAAHRDAISERVARELQDRICVLQSRLPDFPQAETCDLLIVDRRVDAVSPVVHDWSYECLCRDLLKMRGSSYRYKYTANNGKAEEKDVCLDESDLLFRELRSLHFADVLQSIAERTDKFKASNKAAERGSSKDVSVGAMKRVVESLPAYREQLQKLSVHSTVADELSSAIKARSLNAIGALEQQLLFRDATSKELLRLLDTLRPPTGGGRRGEAEAAASDRLRLLLCYFGSHSEKLDGAAGLEKWKSAASLSPDDLGAVLNLELLGCAVLKKPPGAAKAKKQRRKPPANEEGWDLPKFAPRLQELLTDLSAGSLSPEAFPFVQPGSSSQAGPAAKAPRAAGTSVRSVRSAAAAPSWASSRRATGELALSDLRLEDKAGRARSARRLVVFMVGPVGYGEVRCAHELAASLGRDVLLGGTSVCSPDEFLNKLKAL